MTTLMMLALLGCQPAEEAPVPPVQTEEPAAPAPAADPTPAARANGHAAPLGDGQAEVVVADGQLRLYVTGPDGAPVAPEGEARVVLTPHGGQERRLVLAPAGDHFAAPTDADVAKGATAVVSATVGGVEQSARITWGEAAKPHEHGDGGHHH